MEESEVLKGELFRQYLEKGIKDIFAAQRQIAAKKLADPTPRQARSRSGELMRSLQNPQYMLQPEGGGVRSEIYWPTYIRFLDMKRQGNWKIYNRQVWGILYKETFVKMRFEISKKLQEYTAEILSRSFEPLNKK